MITYNYWLFETKVKAVGEYNGGGVVYGSPEADLPERTPGLLIYFPSILGHAPENRVGTLKA